jgi:hypothetical protein
MIKLSDVKVQDEEEMRAFYRSLGISESVTEAAIKKRLSKPVVNGGKPSPWNSKKRKSKAGS